MSDKEVSQELKITLLAFVKQASEKTATAAEVEALPAVALVLGKMIGVVQ